MRAFGNDLDALSARARVSLAAQAGLRVCSRAVKLRGTYKLTNRSLAYERLLHPSLRSTRRVERILQSLRTEIVGGSGPVGVRIRRILSDPREIWRLEIQLPELGYQRTTLLDRDTLEELLASDDVRERVAGAGLPG
jgi:hypothetical protein